MSLESTLAHSEIEALRVELDRIRRMLELVIARQREPAILNTIALQLIIVDVLIEERGYNSLADDIRNLKKLIANLAIASKLSNISRRAAQARRWRKR